LLASLARRDALQGIDRARLQEVALAKKKLRRRLERQQRQITYYPARGAIASPRGSHEVYHGRKRNDFEHSQK
jgi:hypothetical protein